EHVPGQKEFLAQLPLFVAEGGLVFFAFPPWAMPYGGHQQLCRNKWLARLPYFHLLPGSVYRAILRLTGEPDHVIKDLQEIKNTGISIERFERYLRVNHLTTVAKAHYLVNPIYQYKFGMKPRRVWSWISRIPWFRNFITTGVYYLVRV